MTDVRLSNTVTFAYNVSEGFQHKQDTVAVVIDLKDTCNHVDFAHLIQ